MQTNASHNSAHAHIQTNQTVNGNNSQQQQQQQSTNGLATSIANNGVQQQQNPLTQTQQNA